LDLKRLAQSLDRIFATTQFEIACSEMQTALPDYVEFELAGGAAAELYPQVADHMIQCPDCHDEYLGLLDVARLELQDRLPSAEKILSSFPPEAAVEPAETSAERQRDLAPATGR
jgi:hypothetical protein